MSHHYVTTSYTFMRVHTVLCCMQAHKTWTLMYYLWFPSRCGWHKNGRYPSPGTSVTCNGDDIRAKFSQELNSSGFVFATPITKLLITPLHYRVHAICIPTQLMHAYTGQLYSLTLPNIPITTTYPMQVPITMYTYLHPWKFQSQT